GGLPLAPILLTATAPEPRPARGERPPERLGIHPADHEDVLRADVLHHGDDEPVRAEADLGQLLGRRLDRLSDGRGHRYSPVPPSMRSEATACTSRSRRIRNSSPLTSTSKHSSGLNRTVSPGRTVRTCGPTAATSAHESRLATWAVAGMR